LAFNILNIGYDGTVSSTYAERDIFTANEGTDDLIYFLGTSFGEGSFSNPSGSEITLSTVGSVVNSPTILTDRVYDIATGTEYYGSTAGWGFEMEFTNCAVSPTRIDIYRQFGASSTSFDIVSQVWQGSNDGVAWTFLDDGGFIDASFFSLGWNTSYSNANVGFYKFLRVLFTSGGGYGVNGMRLEEIEMYGKVKRTDGGEASRISLPTTITELPDVDLDTPADGDYLEWVGGVVRNTREKLYETVRTTNNVVLADNQFLPNFYIITPSNTRTVDLPNTPVIGQYFRIRNLNNSFEVQIREPIAVVVATIGGVGGLGLTQADCYYDGTEWTIITY